jgi:preprotein translocase subunit SecD
MKQWVWTGVGIALAIAAVVVAYKYRSKPPQFQPAGPGAVKLALKVGRDAPFDGSSPVTVPGKPSRDRSRPDLPDLTLHVAREAAVTGDDVAGTDVGRDGKDEYGWYVTVVLKPASRAKFAKLTAENRDRSLVVFLDDRPLMAPRIVTAMTDGVAVITGDYTEAEATDLARKLVGR